MKKAPRIFLTRPWPEPVMRRLSQSYDAVWDQADPQCCREQLRWAMANFDALCPTVTDDVDAEIIAAPSARVRIIANYGVGVDHIDLRAAKAAGIPVTNTPGVLTETTAELALLLILMASRRAAQGERDLRNGRWGGWSPTHMLGQNMQGKLLGLVGFGRIGQALAQKAKAALNMKIGYHSRNKSDAHTDARYFPVLEDLIKSADVLSLHCPGGDATWHLIDERRLQLMKPSAILVNTSRGTVVNERALARALSSGRLAAAALDVYEREPEVCQELLCLENVVLLPHLGSATLETRVAMGMRAADNLDAFFSGVEPCDRVI